MKNRIKKAWHKAWEVWKDNRGLSHTTEILIGIAVVVVVGGLIIAAATDSLPGIFESLMTKVSGLFAATP